MENKVMEKLVAKGEALDLSRYPKDAQGFTILPSDLDIEGKDLCLATTEQWIWSVGRHKETGVVLASTCTILAKRDDYKCIWLR